MDLSDEAEFSEAVRSVLSESPTLAERRSQRSAAPATPLEIRSATMAVDDWLSCGNRPAKPTAMESAVRQASVALAGALDRAPSAAEPKGP